jgi:hypothetical protein
MVVEFNLIGIILDIHSVGQTNSSDLQKFSRETSSVYI